MKNFRICEHAPYVPEQQCCAVPDKAAASSPGRDRDMHVLKFCFMCLQASLAEMIAPGALVMLTPLVVGILFGTRTLSGILAGALVSGVQMAVSMSNTGGAWDNAKKYVEVSNSPSPSALLLSL